jgi:hypothetical protein
LAESCELDLEVAAQFVSPRDSLLCGFVGGQRVGCLEALGARAHGEQPTALIQLVHSDFRAPPRSASGTP